MTGNQLPEVTDARCDRFPDDCPVPRRRAVAAVSAFIAVTVLPIVAALVVGQGGRLGELIVDGLETVAPVAIMITFAVLYFSLMIDAGLFDPAVRRVVRWAGGDPLKITVGTAVLTQLVALDGRRPHLPDHGLGDAADLRAARDAQARARGRDRPRRRCHEHGALGRPDRTGDGRPRPRQRSPVHPRPLRDGRRDPLGPRGRLPHRPGGAQADRHRDGARRAPRRLSRPRRRARRRPVPSPRPHW